MKRKAILLLVLNLFVLNLFCQGLTYTLLGMPKDYLRVYYSDLLSGNINSHSKAVTTKVWEVFVDRANIKSHRGVPLIPYKEYFVVNENPNQLYLIEAESYDPYLLSPIGDNIKDIGWVDKSNIVFWPYALRDDQSKFTLKVMTVASPDNISEFVSKKFSQGSFMLFYDDPYTTVTNNKRTKLFNIYYVYKEEGNRVLIGTRPDFDEMESIDAIQGWVDKDKIEIWEQLVALSPQTDFVGERSNLDLPIAAFETSENALIYAQTGERNALIWQEDYNAELTGYTKRSPIYNQTEMEGETIFETSIISDLYQSGGQKISSTIVAELEKKISQYKNKRGKINFVFVVDGTRSMAPYFGAIVNGIENGLIRINNSSAKLQFGAVIYRDYEDPDNSSCFETKRIGSDGDLKQFLQSIYTNDPMCYTNTISEGMFLGIEKSIMEVFRGHKDETNIMVIIGDAGDRVGKNRISKDDVVPLLKEYNASIMALQVNRGKNNEYDDFIGQVTEMVKDVGYQLSDELNENQMLSSLQTENKPKFVLENTSDGRVKEYVLMDGPIRAGFTYLDKRDESMAADYVSKKIETILAMETKFLDKSIIELENMLKNKDVKEKKGFSPYVVQMLLKMGIQQNEMDILQSEGLQFMIRCYTPMATQRMKHLPFYEHVIFLNSGELTAMYQTFSKLRDAASSNASRRQNLKTVWLEQTKMYYGAGDSEIMASKPLSELLQLAKGIIGSENSWLKEYSISDLLDELKISDAQLDLLVRKFDQYTLNIENYQRKKEEEEKDDLDKYSFESNGITYHWYPTRYLP